jgi:hypothetical protein
LFLQEAPWSENSGLSIWRPIPPSGCVIRLHKKDYVFASHIQCERFS